MEESRPAVSHHSLMLEETVTARLNQIYKTRSHADETMDLTNYVLLAVERNMVSNKFGLDIFYTAFKEAAKCAGVETGIPNSERDNKFVLLKENFYLAMQFLATAIFAHEGNGAFEAMFSHMLVEKIVTHDKQLVGGRAPKQNEKTLDILSEDSIKVYLIYYDQLKRLYTNYLRENFNANLEKDTEKRKTWKNIEEDNITMPVSAFVKMCKCKKLIIENGLNIEELNELITDTIQPLTNDEYQFLVVEKKLIEICQKDQQAEESLLESFEGEPGLMFHEFIFLLALIAITRPTKDADQARNIEDFFVQSLQFKEIDESEQRAMRTFEQIKASILNPQAHKRTRTELDEDDEFESDDGSSSEFEEQQAQLRKFLQQKAEEEAEFIFEFDEVLDELDSILPMIPGKPEVVQIQPRPDPKAEPIRIKFGKLAPKEKEKKDDKKKKPAAQKQQARKKDEKPPPIVRWADAPKKEPPSTLELLRELQNQLEERVFPNNIRADQSNPGIMPTIIKEVFFPPSSKYQDVATLIESALVYQNSANYEMAIKAFENARDMWRNLENPPKKAEEAKAGDASPKKKSQAEKAPEPKLRPELELYFEMSLGSVYESCGKDDIAMTCYMRATKITLSHNHPDEAFPYCGLGSVLYHIDEPAWALRCFLKAREIREERLGGDTVDTATVYNNLGACMYMLERNQECKAYFELSNAIMDAELGPQHERTLTTARNILRANRTVQDVKVEYRYLWSTYIPTMGGKKGGKKGKGKKKKK